MYTFLEQTTEINWGSQSLRIASLQTKTHCCINSFSLKWIDRRSVFVFACSLIHKNFGFIGDARKVTNHPKSLTKINLPRSLPEKFISFASQLARDDPDDKNYSLN